MPSKVISSLLLET